HAVLETSEIAGKVRPDHIGARRQELPKLDVARPEPCQGRADARLHALTATEGPCQRLHRPRRRTREPERPGHGDALRHEAHTVLGEDEPGAREAQEIEDRAGHGAGAVRWWDDITRGGRLPRSAGASSRMPTRGYGSFSARSTCITSGLWIILDRAGAMGGAAPLTDSPGAGRE